MGRMINVFDLSAGMAGTKLPTDKAHRDGSPSHRNRPDAFKKAIDPFVVHAEDKPVISELRKSSSSKKSGGTPMKMLMAQEMSSSSKKSGGTPMKMLMAQEMSKETESKRKPPNVVARLMGLDEALPAHQSVLTAKKSLEESSHSSHVTLARAFQDCQQQEDSYFDRPMPSEIHSCAHEEKEYRDVYEVWPQPPRTSCIKDQHLQKGRNNENQSERRMALVRQKFMEAKWLATDEKLLQSKEFQDALEVLSSNRDLFLKFLEEPNSLFSKQLKELHSIPPPQTKRITVLKPSRTVVTKGDNQVKKKQYPACNEGEWDLNKPQWSSSVTQPTRIVVLKPSPGKHHDTKPMVTHHISSPELMQKDFCQDLETSESIGSRGVANEITRQMRESLSSYRRDESLLSSVLSNGYVGDESSFNRSENEYIEEEGGNFSDSETASPTSRHSWDYANRIGRPYSLSSLSRTSYSPEPSVIREAKKRLSERWALVASNGINREQMEVRRSSSTLGEMLAIPEVKKEEVSVGGLPVSSSRSCGREEDLTVPTPSLSTCKTKDGDGVERSPWNLSRSKSVPVSSSAYENIGLNSEVLDSQGKKPIVPKEAAKSKSGRSSFKGKVSSLFFSRNKKAGREKSISSPLVGSDDRIQSGSAEPVGKKNEDLLNSVHNSQFEYSPLINSEEESIKASSPTSVKDGPKQGSISFRVALSLEKPSTSESLSDDQDNPSTSDKTSENKDQPSPTSVLDAPFEDDTNNSTPNPSEISDAGLPLVPIESVARSLSWDDTHLETSSPNTSILSRTLPKADEEEQQRLLFVQNLLSTAGLDNEKLNTVFTGWHSVDSPLDPILLDKFLDQKEEVAKSRERRSNQRLLFDCVNSAMLGIGQTAYLGVCPWARACSGARKKALAGVPVGTEVWVLVRDWFSGEGKLELSEADNSSLVVDRLLRRDVRGSRWAELMQAEIDEIGKEIGGEVLEKLVGEALADFTVGCLL